MTTQETITDAALPRNDGGADPRREAPRQLERATIANAAEASETKVVERLYHDASADWPGSIESILCWAREAACIGLAGPKDPGTLPGVMAQKRPPRRAGGPMAEPRPDPSPSPA